MKGVRISMKLSLRYVLFLLLCSCSAFLLPSLTVNAEENTVPTKPVLWWENLQPGTVKCWSPQGNGDHYGAFNEICESENAEYTFQEFMNRLWNNGYQYNIVTELIDTGYGEFLDPGFFSWFITSKPGSARDNNYAPSIPNPVINQNVQIDLFIPSTSETSYKDNYYWSLEPHLKQDEEGNYYLDYYQAKVLELANESGTGRYRKIWFNQILTSTIDPVDDIAKTYTNYNIYYKSGSWVQPGNLFYAMTYGTDQDIIQPVPDPTPLPTPDYSGELGDIDDSLGDLNETNKGIWETIKDGFSFIFELPGKLVELLLDGLSTLLIPSDEFFSDYFSSLSDFFEDKFGFLAYPFTWVVDVLNYYTQLEDTGSYVLSWPNINVPVIGQKIISAGSIDLADALDDPNINEVHEIYLAFVDFMLFLAFLKLCQNKYASIVGGQQDNYEYISTVEGYTADPDTGEVKSLYHQEKRSRREPVS